MTTEPKAPSRLSTEPVVTANTIIALIWAAVLVAISMGWIELNSEQLASWQTLIGLGIPMLLTALTTWWSRSQVKPMAKVNYEAAIEATDQ